MPLKLKIRPQGIFTVAGVRVRNDTNKTIHVAILDSDVVVTRDDYKPKPELPKPGDYTG